MAEEQGAVRAGGGATAGAVQAVLAALTAGDSTRLFDWINDRELVLFNAGFRPVTRAQHDDWFDEIQRRSDAVLLGIRLEPGNELIGTVQLHSIHPVHRAAELQIRIAEPQHRGKGYGSTAVHLALRLAFDDLNLNRVSLHVLAHNARALHTYEKAGFRREGLLRGAAFVDGSYADVVVMGILREEYVGQQ